jgi:carbonic anhydrase
LRIKTSASLLAVALVATACATLDAPHAGDSQPVHWTYSGAGGPEHWAELSPKFSLCASGRNQSPINLTVPIKANLPALSMSYGPNGDEVLNNGHTVQVNFKPGNVLSVGTRRYELKQFHFHKPSENQINGKSFPMEAHLVHADADGSLAVVAVMIEDGASNPMLQAVWASMPEQADVRLALPQAVSALDLLPAQRDYYQFSGSLTTPPCSEGVLWLVMKQAITASAAQIERFGHVMHHDTNRPVQPLYSRTVLE